MSQHTEPFPKSVVENECYLCGLNVHAGDDVVLGQAGWVHPVCGELEAQ